jgi:glycosyltransferase involved in cell wall biosynthesis
MRDEGEISVEQFGPVSSPWLLLVCAYNEGEKLARQMEAFPPPGERCHDTVLVDDGSTDGSTASEALVGWGMRAVLRFPSNRGLSCAIRAGLTWALAQDAYRGVILMNGNNKDDPEALPAFVELLKDGVDYVQGSRFLPGGAGIHTPAFRHWSIRLVHAPLFSLAAGKWMTDTTNGYRAFSRNFLMDPRVRFDREEFRHYEVEQYLAWRAIRLGFRCCEIPVIRRYPAPGKRPVGGISKIRPLVGHWQMLKPLLGLLFRVYD